MKKLLCIGLICLASLCLYSCGLIENEYTVTQPHNEPPATEPEVIEVVIPSADDSAALRELIMSFIREGSARNRIDVTAYKGDLSTELPHLLTRLESNSLYAYAVDYVDHELVEEDGSMFLELNMVLRRSADEIAEIISVRGMAAVEEQIILALENLNTSLTVRAAGFKPMDFERFILQYCLEHPSTIVEIPEISVGEFPNFGKSRVLEFHFSYSNSKSEYRTMQKNVNTMLNSVSSFVARGENDRDRFTLLCEYLVGRTRHGSSSAPSCAYNLLCQQEASDSSFASVVSYIADQYGTECYLVQGTRDGAPYCWNIILIDDEYYHIDMMRQWTLGESTLELLSDSDMEGFIWDRFSYPPCVVAEEPETEANPVFEPSETTDPVESSGETEAETQPDPTEAETDPATESTTESAVDPGEPTASPEPDEPQ